MCGIFTTGLNAALFLFTKLATLLLCAELISVDACEMAWVRGRLAFLVLLSSLRKSF